MAPEELTHHKWMPNHRATSKCDFCHRKNTVLQMCEAVGCYINICRDCMGSGILEGDMKHKLKGDQVDHFDWEKAKTSRGSGPGNRFRQRPSNTHPQIPRDANLLRGPSVIPNSPSAPNLYGNHYNGGPYMGFMADPYAATMPHMAYAPTPYGPHIQHSGFSGGHPTTPFPHPTHERYGWNTSYGPAHHEQQQAPPDAIQRHFGRVDQNVETSPARRAKRRRQYSSSEEASSTKRGAARVQNHRRQVSEETLEAANILVSMATQGINLSSSPTLSSDTIAEEVSPAFSVDIQQAESLPMTDSSGSSHFGNKPQATTIRAPDEEVPWNPMEASLPIDQVQWNERVEDGGLSTRALALRSVWTQIMDYVIRHFNDYPYAPLPQSKINQFRSAWDSLSAHMEDQTPAHRLDQAISTAVLETIRQHLGEVLSRWDD